MSLRLSSMSWLRALVVCFALLQAHGFDNSRSDNVAVYWGQDSYGAAGGSSSGWQQPISFYCQDDSIDAIPIAFLDVFFDTGGQPQLDLANTCSSSSDPVFPGTQLPDCSFLASDIETCQAAGKIVTLSLGGATGSDTFSSASQAESFADLIWDEFLGGSSSTRPFGSAVLDGIDLDIEGGSTAYYTDFINQIRSHTNGASKQYYITGAPQCPYPDAYLGSVINAVGFDAIYVQFYNNYCELTEYNNANDWDFSVWDNWAKNTSPNKNVKVYIGAPASPSAAGSGYVDVSTLGSIAVSTRNQYSSFGGIMLWDASQAYANGNFAAGIKNEIRESGSSPTSPPPPPPPTSPPSSPTTHSTTTSTAPTSGPAGCSGVSAWQDNVAYTGGSEVTYNGHLWTAKWWSYGDVPGGTAGDWTDDGACSSANVKAKPAVATGSAAVVTPTDAVKETPNETKAQAANPVETNRKNSRFFRF